MNAATHAFTPAPAAPLVSGNLLFDFHHLWANLNPDETIEVDGDRKTVDLWVHHEDGSRSLADSYSFADAAS